MIALALSALYRTKHCRHGFAPDTLRLLDEDFSRYVHCSAASPGIVGRGGEGAPSGDRDMPAPQPLVLRRAQRWTHRP